MSVNSIPQIEMNVKTRSHINNLAETLALADLCLAKYNEARARFVATGSPEAFRAALAMMQDRETLLANLNNRIEISND